MTLSRTELAELLVESLEDAGFVVSAETALSERPLLLGVASEDLSFGLRVFLWNATPGGPPGVRASDEFRVQTTRPGDVPFLADPSRKTLLLGFHESLEVFAAWDVRTHPNPGSSSSLQVSLDALEDAQSSGFASRRRAVGGGAEEEVVIAFSPENVRSYLLVLDSLQTVFDDAADARLGQLITSGDEPPPEDLPDGQERRVAVHEVVRLVRDARFRTRVRAAYGARCAFCGLGLGLVDAAHIQAVGEGGPDTVANGICACPNHHRAFDRGMLLVNDDLSVDLNQRLIADLGFNPEETAQLDAALLPELRAPQGPAPGKSHLAHHRGRWAS